MLLNDSQKKRTVIEIILALGMMCMGVFIVILSLMFFMFFARMDISTEAKETIELLYHGDIHK